MQIIPCYILSKVITNLDVSLAALNMSIGCSTFRRTRYPSTISSLIINLTSTFTLCAYKIIVDVDIFRNRTYLKNFSFLLFPQSRASLPVVPRSLPVHVLIWNLHLHLYKNKIILWFINLVSFIYKWGLRTRIRHNSALYAGNGLTEQNAILLSHVYGMLLFISRITTF